MARARRIRWPALVVSAVIAAAATYVLVRPTVLAPALTHLINRQLQASLGGSLRVGAYHVRLLSGVDLTDVTFTLPGERGGLTLVAVDTLEIDFRLREVLGLEVRLRRLAASGVDVYHMQEEPRPHAARQLTLPRLRLDQALIDGGQVEVSDPRGRLRERIDELAWRGELASDGKTLTVFTRSGRILWSTRNADLQRLYGRVSVDAEGVHTDGLGGVWNGGEVEVAGLLGHGVLNLDASGRGVEAAAVTDLTGVPLDFTAAGDIDIQLAAARDTLTLAADFSGRFEAWNLRNVHGEAWITARQAVFHTLVGGVEEAHYDGTLTVDSLGVITLEGDVRNVDLQRGLIPETDPAKLPRTAGDGHLRIVHTPGNEATWVRGVLSQGEIDIMPFDSCAVDVWAVADSLHFRRIDLSEGSVRARLQGTSNRREVFAGTLDLTIDDLRDVPAGWRWPPLTGRARGRLALGGRVDELGASGSLAYEDLTLGPLLVDAGEATLVGERVLGERWQLGLATTGPGFHLGGVPLGDYRLWLRADAASAAVDSFRAVRGDTVVTVHGRADFQPDLATIGIDRGAVTLAGNEWRLAGPLDAAMGPGRLTVSRFNLVSQQGQLTADARYSAADSLVDGRLEVRNFDLNLLDPFLRERFRPGGLATATLVVRGTPDDPEADVVGRLVGASFDAAELDSLTLSARFEGGEVRLDTLDLVTDYGNVSVRGTLANPGVAPRGFWAGAALDLDLEIRDGDWRFLEQFAIPALDRLTGRVDGRLHAGGTTGDPLIRGELDSAPFTFQWLKLDRLHGNVRVDRTQLALGDLVGNQDQLVLTGRVELPLRFDLRSQPESPPDGPFLAQLVVPDGSDLAPLVDATSAFTRLEGRGGGELIISGPMSHPRYQGRMAVAGVGFVLRGNEEVFRNCEASGRFADDRLILDRVTGEEGLRGVFSGQGYVLFDGLVLTTWDVDFRADRFLVASIPDLRAVVSTRNGRFTGVPVGPDRLLVPQFEGDYELIKGRYTGNFAETGAGAVDPTLGNVAPDWLADVRITGPPRSARIINNTMELDLSGDVTLVRDADGMVVNGGMTIDNGRLPVFHNTFRVVRGRLDFSRSVGVIPTVDIDAETRVRLRGATAGQSRVERLLVHAVGPASAMSISFSSESGYPREAIERMLLGLSPYPDAQGDQGALTNASIGAGFNLIEREIAREIDLFDTIEIDQIQREQAQGGVGLDPLIGVGKYLGTDLYIKYAQGLNQNDRDLLIEYQINDLLLLQTEVRRRIDEYQGDATYNLDLKYRYEY
ncbi:MAG: translocation/assembly module TamB domain-containing protein [Candidatus Krumholzibacteriia bacterium]